MNVQRKYQILDVVLHKFLSRYEHWAMLNTAFQNIYKRFGCVCYVYVMPYVPNVHVFLFHINLFTDAE